jgi:hypothetical protein
MLVYHGFYKGALMVDTGVMIIRGGRLLNADTRSAPFADVLVQAGVITAVGPPGLVAPPNA